MNYLAVHDAGEPATNSSSGGAPGQPNFLIENLAAGTYTVRTTHRRMAVVFLDTYNDGVLDAGEQSDAAEADGFYWFRQLVPGEYRIRVVVPAG